MSYALLTGASETSADLPLTRDSPDSHRERLLRAAHQAGLEPNDVVRLAEALTGRSWDCCGRAEISLIARALLEASSRALSGQSEGARPCAG